MVDTVSTRDGLSISTPEGELLITAIAPGALRVRCGGLNKAVDDHILIYASTVPAEVSTSGGKSVLSTSELSASFDHGTGLLRFLDAQGNVLLEEIQGGRKITSSTIQGKATFASEVSFESPDSERLFGSGQFQDGFLNIRDLPRRLTQVNTQIAVPFFTSSRGYALLWNNLGLTDLNPTEHTLTLSAEAAGTTETQDTTTSEGTQAVTRTEQTFSGGFEVAESGRYAMMFDIGQSMAQKFDITIDGVKVVDIANLWLPPTTSWFMDLDAGSHRVSVSATTEDKPTIHWRLSGSRTVLRSPVSEGIDYIVFAGSGDKAIASYRNLTGQAPLMPLWAYGFIQCRERYTSSEHLIETDWLYWGKYGWNAMQWDEEFYPDPADLVDKLHALHARLMVSVWSKIYPGCEVGRELTAKNLYIPGTEWVDFFNPEARNVYWSNFSRRMLSLGVDAWWMDASEPENDDLAGRMTHAGPGDLYRLLYPLLVTQTVYEGQRRDSPEKRVCILTRSAFLGEQRYSAATWSGDVGNDWETLRRQVTGGLNYCVSGFPYWTTDTGGFFRPTEQYGDEGFRERYIRWLQYSTFTPLMRVHGYQTETEPWHFGETVLREQQSLLNLRYRLLPYIYSQAAAVTLKGSTLMRPLVMDFAHDPQALDQMYEFLFGPAFLVAPVLEPGVRQWKVYAPVTKGGWFDWWSDAHVVGGETSVVDAPLSQIPLLVRAGSIVPIGPVQQYTGEDTSGDLEIRVFPGADATFELYEDGGTTYEYEKGEYTIIRFNWDDAARCLRIGQEGEFPGMVRERRLAVRIVGTGVERIVEYRGEEQRVSF